jgi:hypothetical protein
MEAVRDPADWCCLIAISTHIERGSDHVSEAATKASDQTHADLRQLWRRIYTQPQ